ncbi:hypothetical protein ANO11243_004240 [Dothideomycetidae sp. 11243]|nr:hypothetical protein ANO11243_004240 [fungal sp. No.11243]
MIPLVSPGDLWQLYQKTKALIQKLKNIPAQVARLKKRLLDLESQLVRLKTNFLTASGEIVAHLTAAARTDLQRILNDLYVNIKGIKTILTERTGSKHGELIFVLGDSQERLDELERDIAYHRTELMQWLLMTVAEKLLSPANPAPPPPGSFAKAAQAAIAETKQNKEKQPPLPLIAEAARATVAETKKNEKKQLPMPTFAETAQMASTEMKKNEKRQPPMPTVAAAAQAAAAAAETKQTKKKRPSVLFVDQTNTDQSKVAEAYTRLLCDWTRRAGASPPLGAIDSAGLDVKHGSGIKQFIEPSRDRCPPDLPNYTAMLALLDSIDIRDRGDRGGGGKGGQEKQQENDDHSPGAVVEIEGAVSRRMRVDLWTKCLPRGVSDRLFRDYDYIIVFDDSTVARLDLLRQQLVAQFGACVAPVDMGRIVQLHRYSSDVFIKACGKWPLQNLPDYESWRKTNETVKTAIENWLKSEFGWKKPTH